jgi:hypothetical protein
MLTPTLASTSTSATTTTSAFTRRRTSGIAEMPTALPCSARRSWATRETSVTMRTTNQVLATTSSPVVKPVQMRCTASGSQSDGSSARAAATASASRTGPTIISTMALSSSPRVRRVIRRATPTSTALTSSAATRPPAASASSPIHCQRAVSSTRTEKKTEGSLFANGGSCPNSS